MDAELIGVTISTHRRPEILAKALTQWAQFMPDVLVVVHDVNGDGVATTKNRGIAALMDLGCDHLFLADDDIWPVTAKWWQPYIESDEPHLMHCWGNRRYVKTDGELTVWSWPRGVLLYARRRVVEKVGGMRTVFVHAGEHAEWSRRIHNCGFTRYEFADATAARRGVWFAEDYRRTVPSTLPQSRYSADASQQRRELYAQYRRSTDYVPYR